MRTGKGGVERKTEVRDPVGKLTDPRKFAFRVLTRVHRKGAYLNLLLRYGMPSERMDPRDRALVSEICYGVERYRNALDHVISFLSSRPLVKIHPDLMEFLRIGLYQIMYTDIPVYAAIHETVEAAKGVLHRGNLGFLNALLRRASQRDTNIELPGEVDLRNHLEITLSFPGWLVEYVLTHLGSQEALELFRAQNRRTGLTLRCNTSLIDPLGLLREVEEAGGRGKQSCIFADALEEVELPFERLIGFIEKGFCVVQDLSSMAVCRVVDPKPGMHIIDACAAPGGKTAYLAQLGGPESRITAVDINASRLQALKKTVDRLALKNVKISPGDALRLQDVAGEADVVLVDAPCSGLGTLSRNPDLKWRRTPEDLSRMAALQLELLLGSAPAVRPGGYLVYSVCTYTHEETDRVVEGFLARRPDFTVEDPTPFLPDEWKSSRRGKGVQLWPHRHRAEGMYIARFRRQP